MVKIISAKTRWGRIEGGLMPQAGASLTINGLVIQQESWMAANNSGPVIGQNESTSLTALIVYVAHKTGTAEFRVERNLADRFNIPNVRCLPADQYDAAICYLVDQIEPKPKSA